MQLFEALTIIRDRSQSGAESTHRVDLICGFTPLHLKTLLAAELTLRTNSALDVHTGLFADIPGSLQHSIAEPPDSAVLLLEWSDLDPRLGYRSSGGWRPEKMSDIVESAGLCLARLEKPLSELAEKTTLVVCLPTLPLPPIFPSPTSLADAASLKLQSLVADLAVRLAESGTMRILDAAALDRISSPASRLDAASELRSGFPFTMDHAAALADELASLLKPKPAMKGIITDLDNTLWAGIVGEDGLDGISWDLDHKTHQHALYQEQLAALAGLGVLVAVASKNEASLVEQAFARDDLVFPANSLFPVEANWGPKSESIRRILTAWNIGADSVVFIDDSPIELAEVQAAFPEIQCRQFPTRNEVAVVSLLEELRSLFGRASVSDEDRLRVKSLRAASKLADVEVDSDAFLAKAEAEITAEWNAFDERSLQLINKTNQFNLNGRRLDEAEWRKRAAEPDSILLGVSYTDKFSPLGKISVLLGRQESETLIVDSWVLSCRAFSRRIEHSTLQALFEQTGCRQIQFDFQATDRNDPLQNTLIELTGDPPESGHVTLSQASFQTNCPNLFATVITHERHPHAA
ncbi:MAG: HAD-IIIC family phosphatase [Planctomycetes bacterium]|nr:HAD-IIIC family phosphatase [Planctomycetota bacterium]